MKKMLMVLLCAVLLFSGCTAGETTSSAPESQSSSSAQTEESSSQPEEIDPAVREMMEALAGYQPGTAGSSLKVYIAACGVLDYAEEYDAAKEETLRSDVAAWLAQADPITREGLLEGQEAVRQAAEAILSGSEESRAMLADAGVPNRYESYHPERYEAVMQVLDDLLQAEPAG